MIEPNQILYAICVEKQCQSMRFYDFSNFQSTLLHKHHKTISFNVLQMEVIDRTQAIKNMEFQIEEIIQALLNKIKILKSNLNKIYQQNENPIQGAIIRGDFELIKQYQDQFDSFILDYKQKNDYEIKIQKIIQNYQQQLAELKDELFYEHQEENLLQLQQKSRKQEDNMIQITFSDQLKGRWIQNNKYIAKQIKYTSKTQTWEQGLILCDPPLPKTKISKFAFEIYNTSTYLGIGYEQIIKNNNYGFPFKQSGLYVIDYLGYSYSYTNKAQDYKKISFQFDAGDIIQCQIDPIKKVLAQPNKYQQKLSFRCERTKQQIALDIEILKNDELRACALLYTKQDQIKICQDYYFEDININQE